VGHYAGQMRIILLIGAILTAISVSGQKAPVRFIPVDSISIVRPGQKVKLDFKTNELNIGGYPRTYASLRGAKHVPESTAWVGDTVYLTIDGKKIEFIERKGKTVDWYLFMIECLESKTYKQGHSLIIRHSTIQDIKSDSIMFRLTIELYKQKNNRKWKEINSRTIDLWIESKELEGVLISEIEDE
jgi:hypothetical protein